MTACNAPSDRTIRNSRRKSQKSRPIDNHAHPVRPVAAGEQPDDEYDALPVEKSRSPI